MPIKPENKALYPPNWSSEIVPMIRRRSGGVCEWCGVPNHELGGRAHDGKWHRVQPTGTDGMNLTWPAQGEWAWCDGHEKHLRIVRIVLTVMHLDHNPANCAPENLKDACQRCHNRYDQAHRRKNAEKTRRSRKALGDLFETSV